MVLQQTNSALLADMYTIFSYPDYIILCSYLVSVLRNAEYKYKSPTLLDR